MRNEIYPRAVAFCPMKGAEIDCNDCAGCEHYGGHDVNTGERDSARPPVFFIDCRYPGQLSGLVS